MNARRIMVRLAGAIALLAGSVASGGCEAIVGDSLPTTIQCAGDLLTSCPSGQSCLDGLCVTTPIPVRDAGRDVFVFDAHVVLDAGRDTSKPPPADVGIDAPAALTLGASCGGNPTGCVSPLFCLDTGDLTFSGGGSICSQTCCSDSDCGGTNVCYGTSGGNYCVTADTASQHCPSGNCGTACCSSTSSGGCSSGTCGLGTGPTGGSSPQCATGSDLHKDGDECDTDTQCASGFCDGFECDEAVDCCNASDCEGSEGGGGTCNWFEGTDFNNATLIFRACGGSGTAGAGQGCTNNPNPPEGQPSNDCAGGICTALTGSATICTGPCCQDSDCSEVAGWVCRPLNVPLSAGSIELLVCQPPPSTVN